jgi:hypothetical protein
MKRSLHSQPTRTALATSQSKIIRGANPRLDGIFGEGRRDAGWLALQG